MIELLGKNIILDDDFEIKEYYTEKGNMKAFYHKNCIQSLTYVDKEHRNKLCNLYFEFYNLPLEMNPNGQSYLILGGGTLSYPKYFISHYPDKKMTVVEVDKRCIEYSKKYFYLDETIKEFDCDNRLTIIIEDALKYVQSATEKFDYVLIDLFDGKVPLREAYSILNLSNLKQLLSSNGVIIANYIVSKDNKRTYESEIKRASNISKYFKIISTKDNYDRDNKIGNLLLIMSDNLIRISPKYDYIDITEDIIKC